ncbi:MAG: hypothetical protein CMJ69_06845 [Planctomycetaceae bacterium]|nr:hypothetical protein [Planctomycetaceae bacterium]|tara:strand:- start:141 stop:440 length:300 start_codon:yes stop_codon:yes gene_type:complete
MFRVPPLKDWARLSVSAQPNSDRLNIHSLPAVDMELDVVSRPATGNDGREPNTYESLTRWLVTGHMIGRTTSRMQPNLRGPGGFDTRILNTAPGMTTGR